jgi:hypothetical protein
LISPKVNFCLEKYMKEQLRNARDAWWTFAGVIEVDDDNFAEIGSINERRCFEILRLAVDVSSVNPKPHPMPWIDEHLVQRWYKADARVKTTGGEDIVLEFKPAGLPKPGSRGLRRYEAIGHHLKEKGKQRFGLMTCDPDGVFYRNVALLNRYWKVEPGDAAVRAFEDVGNHVAALGELLARTDREQWPAVWAGVARQRLAANLHEEALSRDTLVSMPGYIYQPITIRGLVSTWWA